MNLRVENHKQLPLSQSIILVLEELANFKCDDRQKISFDAEGKARPLFMVRTREESHLGAPISFI
jgi:hypothetical protein